MIYTRRVHTAARDGLIKQIKKPLRPIGDKDEEECSNGLLWVYLFCSGLSLAEFRKISPRHSWTCPNCPSFSQLSSTPSQTVFLSLSSCKNTSKYPFTINNFSNLSNHPQLTSTYPVSDLSLPSPQCNPLLFFLHNLFPSFSSFPKLPTFLLMESQWNFPSLFEII